MTKVITYGTYDLLHYGHIRLLERAKALGDYLIVGVTADDFDKVRGKINVQQSLMERVEAVRALGIADEIIIEEYEGQKIDDIRRYDIDIFAVGSDWVGYFDYLNEYCKVVYLERTQGVSSSEIRAEKSNISLGIVGDATYLNKVEEESHYVNGITVNCICTESIDALSDSIKSLPFITSDYDELLNNVDAVYIRSQPEEHYQHIKKALLKGKHVLVEAPRVLSEKDWIEVSEIAEKNKLVLMDSLKVAYCTAYERLILLLKAGKIGDVVSINATCTSVIDYDVTSIIDRKQKWNNIYEWGPTALLPVFQVLGTKYIENTIIARFRDNEMLSDDFINMSFLYSNSYASVKTANGVKAEGDLIIAGTKGYVYVPAPWWKTDYFEIRYEDQSLNRRYFYQLDGEGIRYELVSFIKAIEHCDNNTKIETSVSLAITKVMEQFRRKEIKIIKRNEEGNYSQ